MTKSKKSSQSKKAQAKPKKKAAAKRKPSSADLQDESVLADEDVVTGSDDGSLDIDDDEDEFKGMTRPERLKAETEKRSQRRMKSNTAKLAADPAAAETTTTKVVPAKAAEAPEAKDKNLKQVAKLPEAITAMNKILKDLPALHKKKHFIIQFNSLKDGSYQVSCHENGDIE